MATSENNLKSVRDQVRELEKLVLDAQDALDVALRGLRTLEDRLTATAAAAAADRPETSSTR
jgi:hypothetical protein